MARGRQISSKLPEFIVRRVHVMVNLSQDETYRDAVQLGCKRCAGRFILPDGLPDTPTTVCPHCMKTSQLPA